MLDQINDRQAVAQVADTFRMVYTPFHGTGYQQIPYVLEQLGIRHLHCVPEQMVIDGTFPTVKSPNPETPESFALAQKLAKDQMFSRLVRRLRLRLLSSMRTIRKSA